MKPENGINNRWDLIEQATGVKDLKHKFNAYSWYNDCHLKISREEHWCGWWNDCFDFVTVFPKDNLGVKMMQTIRDLFTRNGYTVSDLINNGISIHYETMTAKESNDKATENLLSGGRMSD